MPEFFRGALSRFIVRTAVLLMCLASAFGAQARRLPDPFTPYETSRPRMAARIASHGKLQGVRVVWTRQNGFQSFSLLLAAVLCLVMLELKVHRRATGRHERLASALAGSLRSGALEFSGAARASKLAQLLWTEPEEPEESPPAEPTPAIPSRYALLAYDRTLAEAPPLTAVTRQFGAAATAVDTDMLRGVPLYLLKPQVERSISEVEVEPLPPARWLLSHSQPVSEPAAVE